MNHAAPCQYHLDVQVTPERVGQVARILTAHLRHWRLENLARPVDRCITVLLHTIAERRAQAGDMGGATAIEMSWNGEYLIAAVSDGTDAASRGRPAADDCLSRIAELSDSCGRCATPMGRIIWFAYRVGVADRETLARRTPQPVAGASCGVPGAGPQRVVIAAPVDADAVSGRAPVLSGTGS
ncbi:pep a2 [Streptomyces triticagri]|uniref:Pep a2 n=1 Tax=Streptomyces triticagri TaxID=2293568 RepID=A0A372LUC6_9ACTN|nr:pep a2 [Streptomyces triticagri]RFU82268.1 pep a2 [Streptomyces triticagri]